MPNAFFVLCNQNNQIVVKRISLDLNLQRRLTRLFIGQEVEFRAGMQNEIEFTGDWKPDEGEALYVEIPNQTNILEQAVIQNSLALPALDVNNFGREGVKAIFTGHTQNGRTKTLVQKFSSQQILSRRTTIFYSDNVFTELTDPAFNLDNKLVALIENGRLKFMNYHNIRMIFDLSSLYRAATNEDIDNFAAHACLEVADVSSLKQEVDQVARKLIHAIQKDGTLDKHTAQEVRQRATSVGLVVNIQNGKVLMPENRAEIKRLLRFLHDDIYEAPLSRQRYVTNSKKPE